MLKKEYKELLVLLTALCLGKVHPRLYECFVALAPFARLKQRRAGANLFTLFLFICRLFTLLVWRASPCLLPTTQYVNIGTSW